MLQTSYASASPNLCTRYPHAGSDSFSADVLASPVACRVGDDVCFRSDAAMLTQQMACSGGGDETGTDLESTLEGIAASAALFESLAGSSVMLDLYDVFANPSAFPFPPEAGDHATATSASAMPMEMDVVPATEYGFMLPATCQPEVFTSSTGTCSAVSEHQLTMTGTSCGSGQFEMKTVAKSPANLQLSQCLSHATQQDMDIIDFRATTSHGTGTGQLTSPGFRYVFCRPSSIVGFNDTLYVISEVILRVV